MAKHYLHELQIEGEENRNFEITVLRKWSDTGRDCRVQGIYLIIVDKYVISFSKLLSTNNHISHLSFTLISIISLLITCRKIDPIAG